jgi:hypothetical protein
LYRLDSNSYFQGTKHFFFIFKLLKKATDEELKEVELRGNFALRWEKIDEEFFVEGILTGRFQLPLEK